VRGLSGIRPAGVAPGPELVSNGNFATDTVWTKGAGTTIPGGSLSINSAGVTNNYQALPGNPIHAGCHYQVTYTITGYVSGTIALLLATGTSGAIRSSNGTFTERLFVTSVGSQNFNLQAQAGGFVGSVSSASCKKVP